MASFSFSPNVGYLLQTATYNHNGQYDPVTSLATIVSSENIKVQVYPYWFKHIAIQWSVPPTWGSCLFNVYFSSTESFENFQRVNQAPLTGTYLLDTETQEYRKFHKGWYIVEAILLSHGNATVKSPRSSWLTHQRKWVEIRSHEIQRREHILLSKFVGNKTYAFRRKDYGARCSICWDFKAEKVIMDHCVECMGTSFDGGYFEAAPCYLQYDASPSEYSKTYFGVFEPNQTSAWTISMPELHPDDIIVRSGNWDVYKIEQIQPTELQGRTVRQMLKITQLAKGDVENQLVTRISDFPSEYS